MFQESLLYSYIPLRRYLSARISLRGLRRLIWVDTLRIVHNVVFFMERFIYLCRIFHKPHVITASFSDECVTLRDN